MLEIYACLLITLDNQEMHVITTLIDAIRI